MSTTVLGNNEGLNSDSLFQPSYHPSRNKNSRLKKIIFLFLSIGILLTWLLATESGVKVLISGLKFFSPYQISYGSLKGRIWQGLALEQLEIQTSRWIFQAEKLKFKIKFSYLFNNTLKVSNIYLEDAKITPFIKHINQASRTQENSTGLIKTLSGDLNYRINRQRILFNLEKIAFLFQNQVVEGQGRLCLIDKVIQGTYLNLRSPFHILEIQEFAEKPNFLSFNLKLQNPDAKTEHLESQGSVGYDLKKASFQIELNHLKWNHKMIGAWQLDSPGRFTLTANQFSMQPLLIKNMNLNTIANLQGAWDRTEGGNYQISVPKFSLKLPNFSSNGKLDINLKQAPKQSILALDALTGNGHLALEPGNFIINLPGNKKFRSQHQGGELDCFLTTAGARIQFKFQEQFRNYYQGMLQIPHFSFQKPFHQQTLEGELKAKMEDLNLFYHIMPAISRIKGLAEVTAKVSGSLTKPKFQIQGSIPKAIFSIPKQHITFKNFLLNFKGEIPGRMEVENTGTLGGAPYRFSGFFDLLQPQNKNQFFLTGENIRIYNTDNIYILCSPNVYLEYVHKVLKLDGTIVVPEANIILKDELKNIKRSHDIVFLDNIHNKTLIDNFRLVPNLEIVVEDKVHYKGNNLDAKLEGKIKVEQRSDGLLTALGRLMIKEGKYRLQGGMGYIHKGRLMYPPGTLLNDPALDIKIAQKKVGVLEDGTEVGIYVQGTLKKPVYHLYSSNHLQNAEILSRLGFGSNQSESSDQQKQLLSQTALFLASGLHPVFEKLSLEELGVQTREKQRNISTKGDVESVLVVGKSLNQKLYLQYLQGMTEAMGLVRLKYFLTPHLAVGVETDTEEVGADLSFSVEKN